MLSARPPLRKSEIPGPELHIHIHNTHVKNGRIVQTREARIRSRRQITVRPIRAVISDQSGEATTTLSGSGGSPTSISDVNVKAVITIRKKMKEKLNEKIEESWESFVNGIGRGIVIQLVSEEIDPVTKEGKKSSETAVRGWFSNSPDHRCIVEYAANLTVSSSFGRPGAIIITNLHPKEFYLMEITLHGFSEGPVFFPAHSWIHSRNDDPESRVIFSNQPYLPSQTPSGLRELRAAEMVSLRGNGRGERKKFERIYDYATYNDLGNPDKDEDLARPILGGEGRPYPRRCRTGRHPCSSDPFSESRIGKPHPVYVPRDETFEETKQATVSAGALKALLHNLVPSLTAALSSSDNPFQCFTEIDQLYKDGVALKMEESKNVFSSMLLPALMKKVVSASESILKYETPAVISRDRFAWLRDNEFARQTLAGVNPVNIERVQEFPIRSKLDHSVFGSPESALTRECLEQEMNGMSVEEAIQKRRLYILDYHDLFLPFIKKMNALQGRKAYASRTIFFLCQKSDSLRPIAIELSLPPTSSSPESKYVYTHGHDATSYWTWKLAKAHVCSNDAGVHQLVNHWLRTHACMEPYIIATHRQLSCMHPVYKLLHPHMRYTMEINALARQSLINAGGVIEACFSPGKYSMEVSSAAYKNWRFDYEALPADLIRRGMAVEDPSKSCGVRLLIEDYPYASDGLLIWEAIKEWVEFYVNRYYEEPNSVASDYELQAWWDEIQNKGHPDKKKEPWWPKLSTKEDLSRIVTIIIWTASGQHAAINFGQYPFGSYVPNRPAVMRKLIPQEGEPDYAKFLLNPEQTFLSSIPTQLMATKVMAVQDTLSTHSPDEEYLGQLHITHARWTGDEEIRKGFMGFSSRLDEIEEIINERNRDARLKNRNGAGVPPYELLLPTSGPGVTGRGIPNSISI